MDYHNMGYDELRKRRGFIQSQLRSETGEERKELEYELEQIDAEIERQRREGSINKERTMSVKQEEQAVMSAIDGKTADYQGWKNYETWSVALLIDNDQGLYEMVREWAQEETANAPQSEQVSDDIWSVSEAAKFNLADRIKNYVEEENPLAEDVSMYSQLLSGAISEVDFVEVAEHYLEEGAGEESTASKEEQDIVAAIDGKEVTAQEDVIDAPVGEEQAAVEAVIDGNEV